MINPLYTFIYLSLYFTLRHINEELALIALILGMIATLSFISTRPVLEIFVLGNHYAASETEAKKALYLAAGEALLTRFHGNGWYISMFFSAGSHLISSLLILKSDRFKKITPLPLVYHPKYSLTH